MVTKTGVSLRCGKTLVGRRTSLSMVPLRLTSEFSGLGVIIGLASDIVDNRNIMGDKWSDNVYNSILQSSRVGLVSKEMYEPIDQIMRLDEEGVRNRWIASTRYLPTLC